MNPHSHPSDDDPDRARAHAIVLGTGDIAGGAKAPTRAQKTFQRWVRQIDTQRRQLAEWRAFEQSFGSRLAGELDPLRRKVDAQRLALLRVLDTAYDGDALTRRESARLASVIRELAEDLLAHGDDPDVIAVHDRHSDVAYAELRRGPKRVIEAEAAADTASDADAAAGTSGDAPDAVPRYRDADAEAATEPPRSARARTRLDRERAAAAGATRSLRDVFRRLASALHPDREPDPAERARKTTLMQRVNQAYGDRDLLQLLMLQIEADQIDPSRLAELGDERLGHYNRVLETQSGTLDRQIREIIAPFAMQIPGRGGRLPTPATIMDAFRQEVAALRRESRQVTEDLALFRDARYLKAWLRSLRVA